MRRTVIAAAAAGIVVSAAACGPAAQPRARPSGGATGTWVIVSCRVDVTYLDQVNTVDYYVPDTGANFRRQDAGNLSGSADLAVVVTFVNHSAAPAALPTGLVVSFSDQAGRPVGSPQSFNNASGTGYGAAVAHGRGSGEVFSSGTLFNPGQAVAESPDLGAPVPRQPDLTCGVSPSGAP